MKHAHKQIEIHIIKKEIKDQRGYVTYINSQACKCQGEHGFLVQRLETLDQAVWFKIPISFT